MLAYYFFTNFMPHPDSIPPLNTGTAGAVPKSSIEAEFTTDILEGDIDAAVSLLQKGIQARIKEGGAKGDNGVIRNLFTGDDKEGPASDKLFFEGLKGIRKTNILADDEGPISE